MMKIPKKIGFKRKHYSLSGSYYLMFIQEPQYPWNTLAFIQCITKILESSKSYTRKIYVGSIGAYLRQTSIIVLYTIRIWRC
jgi:hypothetical protein